tara:strand:+ start:111 stop:404 length:294 start_codon:yes stop_codon:yes gene_type:complete
MSSIYFSGEKAPKEEAVKALMAEMVDYTDGTFWVRFESDDTSNHLTAIIESTHSASSKEFKLKKAFPPKYMGWRLIVKSVPINYIKHIIHAKEFDND